MTGRKQVEAKQKAGGSEARQAGKKQGVSEAEGRKMLFFVAGLGRQPSETAHRDLNLAWVGIVLRKEKGGLVVLDV